MGNSTSESDEKTNYLSYLIKQFLTSNLTKNYAISNDRKLKMKPLYNNFDEGCYIWDESSSKKYILRKIKVYSEIDKSRLFNQLKKIELLTSDKFFTLKSYLIKTIDNRRYLFVLFEDEEYLMEKGTNNSIDSDIYHQKINDLSENGKWTVFINLLLSLKILEKNKIIIENLIPDNIYYYEQKSPSEKILFKLIGYKDILDNTQKYKTIIKENYFCPYFPPEKIYNKSSSKSNIWSLGCIFYELFFNKTLFKTKSEIINIKYDLGNNCNKDFKTFLQKLICDEKYRLTLDGVLHDKFVINKLKEMNYFYELIKENLTELDFKGPKSELEGN